ncbi:MAG: NAD(P)/FAD-dependent oxidoreductase [Archangium sp.]|nr:NAD(P)/FAD-dependent oxidoreductase [Archangium sp.]
MAWDTIVIGSGPGGLTAAVALARAGQRVLVLEQHTLPGGWTHSFTLQGYRFSPGVHYLGNLQEGGGLRELYEGLGVAGELEFSELNPDGFDHFLFDGRRFDQPRGVERWINRLGEAFPGEREGLARYFSTLEHVVEELKTIDTSLRFPGVLSLPFRAPHLLRWGFRTLQPLLDDCISDPLLRAVLAAQCGNHGLGPSRVSLPMHAAMAASFYRGAFYPRGGAKQIPRAFIRELHRRGGQIRVGTRVSEILVEAGHTTGVRTEDGERIDAPQVVCNADPAEVFGKLLRAKHCPAGLRKARRTEYSVSSLSLFCAVELDLKALGYDSGNYWWHRTTDLDGLYQHMGRELPGDELDMLFLAITSLKDPGHTPAGLHTLELFTFLPWAPFERWARTPQGHRAPEYLALKQQLAERALRTAEHVIPGLRQHVRFLEIGTPLTNDFYCETHHGAIYGTAKTPWQLGPFSFDSRGPVEGLHFCGASTLCHGVAGASMSGLAVAARMLGYDDAARCLGPRAQHLRISLSEGGLPAPR